MEALRHVTKDKQRHSLLVTLQGINPMAEKNVSRYHDGSKAIPKSDSYTRSSRIPQSRKI